MKKEGLDKGDKDGISNGFSLALLHVLCGTPNGGAALELHKGMAAGRDLGLAIKALPPSNGNSLQVPALI